LAVPKRNGTGIDLLADPTRRRIVGLLAIRPRRPSSLAAELGLSRPATTRQLHLLRDAGLIVVTRSYADRRVLLYRLNPSTQGAITAWLVGTDIGAPYRLQLARRSEEDKR
jgi:DNA-binding transcriptional ArsR family regulator